MEVRYVLSDAEERFERIRKTAGLVLGPIVFLLFLFVVPMDALSVEAARLAAVLALVIVLWLTEAVPIPISALLGALLCVLLDVAPAKEVFAPFANPLIFLFIGSFIIAESLALHGLDKRFAFAIFSIRFLQRSPVRVLFALGAIVAAASMWISNTAATAMMFPIALGVLAAMKEMDPHSSGMRGFSNSVMLMVAYAASVGGIATPIGTPPNLIGIGMIKELVGVRISFFEWMAFAAPLTIVMFTYLFIMLRRAGTSRSYSFEGVASYVEKARAGLGKWRPGEVNTAIAFATAVILWILPSLAELFLGKEAALSKLLTARLNEGVVAIFAACLLFMLPVSFKRREFTMTWERASRIDWGTVILFGGGLSLGGLMFSTGLASHMGSAIAGATGASSLWAITAAGTAFAIILSETTSNTASANMVIPVVIAIAQETGVSPMPPALGACLGASFGFMLPVSTPPNAIVYGSGMVPILSMVRKGVLFDIGGFFIIMAGLMIMCPLMGWQ